MADALWCELRTTFPVTVAGISGELSAHTTPLIRAMVLKWLAEQPAAVVLDITDMALADDMALLVFSALARHASVWPACPIVLAVPSVETRTSLDRLGVGRQVDVFPTLDAAYRRAVGVPVPRRVTMVLPPLRDAPAQARQLFAEACQGWGQAHLVSRGQVVLTELVTNAVDHAGTAIDVKITYREPLVHIAVGDGHPSPPRRGAAIDPNSDRGRGLLVVEAFATAWGHVPTVDGKVVWATLRTSPPGRGRTTRTNR